MRHGLAIGVLLLVAAALYLLTWPVPVAPVAWDAPADRGYTPPFEMNDRLRSAAGIDLAGHEGPEDATLGHDGNIYVTTLTGEVLRIDGESATVFATPGGRPLGIETDHDGSLVVANAFLGLQRIDSGGNVTSLLASVDEQPLHDANNLGIAPDGTIYFSISSRKFSSLDHNGSYEASLLDIMEHGGHGAVLSFKPHSGDVEIVLDGLNYANGVAVSGDGYFLLVAETGHYRVLRHWLAGAKAGTTEVLLDNLPGFPDNLRRGLGERFWLGLAAPRNHLLDALSDKPLLRSVVQRLPAFLRPDAMPSSHVVAFNGEGEILANLHDPDARIPTLTGALETPTLLYLTTLFGTRLPHIDNTFL